jgi:hypothetical protein
MVRMQIQIRYRPQPSQRDGQLKLCVPHMKTWWLVLISRSSSDSATTGLGKSGYQSWGARLAVIASDRPSVTRWETSS